MMKRRRWRRLVGLIVAVVGLAVGVDQFLVHRGRWITVGHDTTRISSPLRDDGTVDYFGAMEEEARRGVETANNAAVKFVEAVGPGAIPEQERVGVLRSLRLEGLPKKGAYFVRLEEWGQLQGLGKDDDGLRGLEAMERRCISGFWKREAEPTVASWVEANREAMGRVSEGTRRGGCYFPVERSSDKALCPLAYWPMLKDPAKCLAARAMLAAEEGRWDGCSQDVETMWKLGRMASRSPLLIDRLVAIGIEGNANSVCARLLADGRVPGRVLAGWMAALEKLPERGAVAETVDRSERWMVLHQIQTAAKVGPYRMRDYMTRISGEGDFRVELSWYWALPVDYGEVMRQVNVWHDRSVAAMCLRSPSDRREALRRLTEEREALREERRLSLTGAMARYMVTAVAVDPMMVERIEDQAEQYADLVLVACAVGRYRSEQGKYPDSLQELVGRGLKEVPVDRWGKGEVRYKRTEDGAVVYSVGEDGEDDGGDEAKDVGVRVRRRD